VIPTSFIYNIKQKAETWEVNRQIDAMTNSYHKRIGDKVAFVLLVLLLSGCKVNPNGLPHFDEDGNYLEKDQHFTSMQPTKVKFFVEASGSMNGFFRSNKPTQFKTDIWSIISDFTSLTDGVNIFEQQNKAPKAITLNDFRIKMNAGDFVSSASTDVPDMVQRVLNQTNINKSEVCVLVSDMKYDPVGNAAQSVLLEQYATDIRNMMSDKANSGKALSLIVAKSDYLDKTGNTICYNSPYYYLVIGKPENVVWIRNIVCTLLKHSKHYVDAIEWGIDYKCPKITVSNSDYLQKDDDHLLRKFGNNCNIVLDIDITDYPWLFEKKDSLLKHLSVKMLKGTSITKLKDKSIVYKIADDNGKGIERKAIARVKLHIENMYDTADLLSIQFASPEIQVPNSYFSNYLGSNNPNDCTKTFSMEQFLSGCYSCMERFRDVKPVYILISKR
jgi:hypothetical protein